ncbi:MAG: ComEA family DNA-binding protein [Desulfobacteraceae bacterium]
MKSRKQKNDRPGACLLLLLALLFLGSPGMGAPSAGRSAPSPEPACYVEVRGAVENPGVYGFPAPPPLQAVLSEAGLERDCRERVVTSGTRVTVMKRNSGIQLDLGFMSAYHCKTLGIPIPLNRIDKNELPALPGVGPKLAEAIARTRAEIGGFKRVEELRLVHGIGPKLLDGIRPHVRVP